jgi:hypothetical protein
MRPLDPGIFQLIFQFAIPIPDICMLQDVLNVMVVISVLVNSALIGMGDLAHRVMPGLSDIMTILLIVLVEVRS